MATLSKSCSQVALALLSQPLVPSPNLSPLHLHALLVQACATVRVPPMLHSSSQCHQVLHTFRGPVLSRPGHLPCHPLSFPTQDLITG